MIQFEFVPKTTSIIKVIGVGGGGGNAVSYMHSLGIDGVDFILCNTDAKALANSAVQTKIQLGPSLTQGLGAGANPEIGRQACEESTPEISNLLKENTKMVFVTAGMGGGTGTGAAPVIAKIAKELGILTVGIVTTPFSHEGARRRRQAEEGIAKMREYVDTILIISNDKMRHAFGNLAFTQAFAKADNVLATAAKCITDVINSTGHVGIDFADVCTVMKDGGVAIMGSASASGEDRAKIAVQNAIDSPLLNDNQIAGAKWVLVNINSSKGEFEQTVDEIDAIQAFIQQEAGEECDVILGLGTDDSLGETLSVTIIATGFDYKSTDHAYDAKKVKPEDEKIVLALSNSPKPTETPTTKSEIANLGNAASESAEQAPANPISENTSLHLKQELMPTAQVLHSEPIQIPSFVGLSLMAQQKNVNQTESEPRQVKHLSLESEENQKDESSITPAPADDEKKVVFELTIDTEDLSEGPTTTSKEDVQEDIKEESNNEIKSTIVDDKDIITIDGITINRKIGSRYLTDDEIREKVAFEQHKLAVYERATRLRSMNFNNSQYQSTNKNSAYKESSTPYSEDSSDELSNIKVGQDYIETKNDYLHKNRPC